VAREALRRARAANQRAAMLPAALRSQSYSLPLGNRHRPWFWRERTSRPIASPMLKVDLDPDDPTRIPIVVGHEGRHRMLAILCSVGDVEIPVHLFPVGARARHLTDEMIELLRTRMVREGSSDLVEGALFGDAWVAGRLVPASDIPEGPDGSLGPVPGR
jgi:hypothetical protein